MLPLRALAAAAALSALSACAPAVQADTPQPDVSPAAHIADLDGPQTVAVTRTVTEPTVIEGHPVCADQEPNLAFWDDPQAVPERWRIAEIIWRECRDAEPATRTGS